MNKRLYQVYKAKVMSCKCGKNKKECKGCKYQDGVFCGKDYILDNVIEIYKNHSSDCQDFWENLWKGFQLHYPKLKKQTPKNVFSFWKELNQKYTIEDSWYVRWINKYGYRFLLYLEANTKYIDMYNPFIFKQGAYTIEVGIDSKLNYNDTQYLEDLMAEAIEGAYRKALKIK